MSKQYKHKMEISDLDTLNSNDYDVLGCYELNINADDETEICIPEMSLHDILSLDRDYIENYKYYTYYSSPMKFSELIENYFEVCDPYMSDESDKDTKIEKYSNLISEAVSNIRATRKK